MNTNKHPTVEKYIKILTANGYSKTTCSQYSTHVEKFIESLKMNPHKINKEDINNYLLNYKYSSESNQNQIISSLSLFSKHILLLKKLKIPSIKRPKKSKKAIEVLSKEEVWKIIKNIHHFKQRAIISGLYLHGLRISEILNLRYKNIDRSNGVIHVIQSKGKKDRLVPLHDSWIKYIVDYYKRMNHTVNHTEPIFHPYSESSVRNVLKRVAGDVGIKKNVYPHLLRDSYASHLILDGYDISQVQEILGHNDIKTSRKYIHFSTKNIRKVKLKTDILNEI